MINRRRFLQQGAVGATGFILSSKRGWTKSPASRAADCRIEVLFDEPLGTISPNIYGHFAENLGGVLCDGLWVGPAILNCVS